MTDLPTTLRDLARRVDVRRPILPPPDLAPALLAAADELDKRGARIERQRQEIEAIGLQVAEQAASAERAGDLVKVATQRMAEMQRDARALLAHAEAAVPAVEASREMLARLRPLLNAAVAARNAMEGGR